jgi:O-acetyl-ADP-ribose deacetylase (regulator of RNase III)
MKRGAFMLFDNTDDEREIRKKEFIKKLKILKCDILIKPLENKLNLFQSGKTDPEEVFSTAGYVAREGEKLIGDFKKRPDVVLAGIAMDENLYISSIGEIGVSIRKGKITDFFSDAIINPAAGNGIMSEGISAIIKNAGGSDIEKELISKAPITSEKAISTNAGELTCRHIIHVTATEDSTNDYSAESIKAAISKALELVETLKLKTVAIPAIWENSEGASGPELARATLEAIKSHPAESITKIILAAQTDQAAKAFVETLEEFDEEEI